MVLLDHHLPSFQWELRLVEQTGVSLQRIRFMVSCFASVALSLGWRFVPTPKGITHRSSSPPLPFFFPFFSDLARSHSPSRPPPPLPSFPKPQPATPTP